MKAVERAKLVRSLRQESRRLRLLVLVIGFFLVTLTFVVVSKPDALLFNLNGRLSVDQSPRSLLIRQTVDDVQGQGSVATQDPKVVDDEEEVTSEADEEKRVLTSEPEHAKNEEKATTSQLLGSGGEEGKKGHHGHHKMTLPTVSNYTIRDTEDNDNAKQEEESPPGAGGHGQAGGGALVGGSGDDWCVDLVLARSRVTPPSSWNIAFAVQCLIASLRR